MKKLILLICLFTFSATQAQDLFGGVKFSLNMPSVSGSSTDADLGFSIGYFETMYLSESFALEGEINYTTMSWETTFGSGDQSGSDTYDASFIEIPLMAKYVMDNFHLAAGLQLNFGGMSNTVPLFDASYHTESFRFGARYVAYGEDLVGESTTNYSFYIGYTLF